MSVNLKAGRLLLSQYFVNMALSKTGLRKRQKTEIESMLRRGRHGLNFPRKACNNVLVLNGIYNAYRLPLAHMLRPFFVISISRIIIKTSNKLHELTDDLKPNLCFSARQCRPPRTAKLQAHTMHNVYNALWACRLAIIGLWVIPHVRLFFAQANRKPRRHFPVLSRSSTAGCCTFTLVGYFNL